MEIKDKLIIALDFSSFDEVKSFLDGFDLKDACSPSFVKVGMELFYAEGERVINYLKELNLKIFLDLKLLDIPNTVHKSLKILTQYQPEIINVHALGGIEMMMRAKEAVQETNPTTKLIAVTYLTSVNQSILNNELGVPDDINAAVLRLAKNASIAGLDGVVSSAQEAQLIKSSLPHSFITVCPGVRFKDQDSYQAQDDQKRVLSPSEAIANGADYLVIGRAITKANDPKEAFNKALKECQVPV